MSEIWPLTLPQKPQVGAKEPFANNKISFKPDVGPSIDRRRATVAGGETSYTMRLSHAQALIFKTFYTTTLMDGIKSFTGLTTPLGDAVDFKITEFELSSIRADWFQLIMKLEVYP